tara:strand:- start:249 stop:980 length:732 start_codon:yes stop_codon:yes gene_type:complete
MAFKMKGSPMARNYGGAFKKPMGENHDGLDHDNTSHKDDAKAVRKAKGTEDQEVGNLLNVLSEVGSGGKVDRFKGYSERDAEREHYEDQVTSKLGNVPTYRGDGGTSQMDLAVAGARKSDDAGVESGGGKTPGLNQSKDVDEYYRTNQTQAEIDAIASAEARDKAKTKAANKSIIEQATKRTGQNTEGKEAQVRIDTKAAVDAEKARVDGLSGSERRKEEKAKKDSAMPKSGFKMQRKGNYGK